MNLLESREEGVVMKRSYNAQKFKRRKIMNKLVINTNESTQMKIIIPKLIESNRIKF